MYVYYDSVAVLLLLLWVAGTLSTVTKSYLLVKIGMTGSCSRGVGYRILLY